MSFLKEIEDFRAAVENPEEERLCEDDMLKLFASAASILGVPPSLLSDELFQAIENIDKLHNSKRTKPVDLAEEAFKGAVLYLMTLLATGKKLQ